MPKREKIYEVNLEEGLFLIGVSPIEADFVLVAGGKLERIVERRYTLNYEVVLLTDSKKTYFGFQILDYAKRLHDSSRASR